MENIMKNSMFHSWSRSWYVPIWRTSSKLSLLRMTVCEPPDMGGISRSQPCPELCVCLLPCTQSLRKRVGNKCMGTHIFIRNFGGKGYLARLGTIPSVMPFPAIVIALHTCYTLFSITLSVLFLDNTFTSWEFWGACWPFLTCLSRKGLLRLGSLPLTTNNTNRGASDFLSLILHFEVLWNSIKSFDAIVMAHNLQEVLPKFSLWEGPNHIQGLFILRYVLASSLKIANYATQSSQLFDHRSSSIELELHPR